MQVRMKNRKDQIITVALELLQTKGFDSFSYQDLSRELGITKASIHHHFPKKADLGVALCESIQRWHDREYAKARAIEGGALDKMNYYINTSLRNACGVNKICPVSSLQSDMASLPEAMTCVMKKLDKEEIDFMAELLQEGRDSGELHFEGSIQAQALVCVMVYKGALQYSRVHGDDLYRDAMRQLNTLLRGNCEQQRRSA